MSKDLPPVTPESIAAAKAANAAERAAVEQALRIDDVERAELQARLEAFVLRFGAKRVLTITRNLAALHGQEV